MAISLNSDDCNRIVSKLQAEDLTGLGELYDHLNQSIYGKCFFILKNEDAAHDAVHDIFLKVLKQIHQLKDPIKIVGWVNRLCYNHCMDIHRQSSKDRKNEDLQYKSDAEELIVQFDEINKDEKLRVHLSTLINELKEIDRTVILLHYWEGYTIHEIAEELSLSDSAVKMKLKRTRESLHSKLESIGIKSTEPLILVAIILSIK